MQCPKKDNHRRRRKGLLERKNLAAPTRWVWAVLQLLFQQVKRRCPILVKHQFQQLDSLFSICNLI
jgi:hypothetical protein